MEMYLVTERFLGASETSPMQPGFFCWGGKHFWANIHHFLPEELWWRGGTVGTWLWLSMAGCCGHGGNEVPSLPSLEPAQRFIIHNSPSSPITCRSGHLWDQHIHGGTRGKTPRWGQNSKCRHPLSCPGLPGLPAARLGDSTSPFHSPAALSQGFASPAHSPAPPPCSGPACTTHTLLPCHENPAFFWRTFLSW